MRPDRAWVLLPSGRRLDLLAPEPDTWTNRDLAISLSRAYRWGGHSRWDLPLSVAQHSLLVLVLRQQMQALQKLSAAEALRELLHEAEEAFLCFDPISPLKPHLGEGFSAVTGRLRAAIDTRYRMTPWSRDDYLLHKRADHLAAASEAFHITGWSREPISRSSQPMRKSSSVMDTAAMWKSSSVSSDTTSILSDLTPPQLEAATATGPVLVLAGAGTGKTKTLTAAVVHRIGVRGLSPSRILAATFTNKAAGEMTGRIRACLGDGTAPYWIGTFHGLAARQLRIEPEVAGLRPGFDILDADDSRRIDSWRFRNRN